jgi:hypothetical protein
MEENPDFFVELADYFQTEAEKLEAAMKSANIYNNPSDKGTIREDLLYEFLKNHIPLRCTVTKGGFVFDCLGNKSKQIDIIITNDQTLQFKETSEDKSRQFNCVEGCYAVISVKTRLDKRELFESLDNLASVSSHKELTINPFIQGGSELIRRMPQRIIFAYRGDDADTVNKNCAEYYKTRKFGEQSPDMIIVNNKYYFFKTGDQGLTVDGTRLNPNMYGLYRGPNYAGAGSLSHLISRIQAVSSMSPHMQINLQAYTNAIDKAFLKLVKGK